MKAMSGTTKDNDEGRFKVRDFETTSSFFRFFRGGYKNKNIDMELSYHDY